MNNYKSEMFDGFLLGLTVIASVFLCVKVFLSSVFVWEYDLAIVRG